MWKKLLLVLGSVALTLGLSEWGLSFFPQVTNDQVKIEGTVDEPECSANCYSSNPRGYFPATLHQKTVGKDLKEYDKTWYCLPYQCRQRKQGYFPGRPKELFLVGDSFTFGEGNREEDTLGNVLAVRYPDYNVRNFGRIGADTREVAKFVKDLLVDRPQDPPVKSIIYFYNLNDVAMTPAVAARQKYIIDFENLRWTNVQRDESGYGHFMARFALYRLFKKAMVLNRETGLTVKNYLDMYLGAENSAEYKQTLDTISAMNALAREHNAAFTMVIYPFLYKDRWGRYPFLPIHRALLAACRERGIDCIDGYEAFKDERVMTKYIVHPVDFHPNGLANARLADYLRTQRAGW